MSSLILSSTKPHVDKVCFMESVNWSNYSYMPVLFPVFWKIKTKFFIFISAAMACEFMQKWSLSEFYCGIVYLHILLLNECHPSVFKYHINQVLMVVPLAVISINKTIGCFTFLVKQCFQCLLDNLIIQISSQVFVCLATGP
jgi:hypothetical protein